MDSIPSIGADVRDVPCSGVVLKFPFGTVELLNKDGRLAMVKIVGSDFLMSVPATELTAIELARLQTVRVVFTGRQNLESSKEFKNDFLVVFLEFGEGREVYLEPKIKDSNGYVKSKKVWDCVYFIFSEKGYSHRDRLILRSDTTKMTMYYKELGANEIENGITTVLGHDEAPWSPPSLPTKN